mmetsp:Transcript_31133/g.90825  ORF Transcript_31133/g.90825 Transcript_31133/m.90825 type:complete len:222 (-) Transcript_31133:537-1202(-)
MVTASTETPWLCGPTKYMAAAWFRALSSSSGFKFTEFSRSRDKPAFSTMARWALKMLSKFESSSSSRSECSLSAQTCSSAPAVPWKPWITARSPSPRPSMVSASTTDLFMVISLSAANFCTTFSKSSVSLPKVVPWLWWWCCWSRSPSLSSSLADSSVSLTATAMSVTDWNIVEAIFRTCKRSFSSGRMTIAATEFDNTNEKHTMSTMTTTSKRMFIKESS